MKKSLLLVLALVLVLAAPLGVLAEEESPMAIKSFQPVELDGEEVEISAYLINGENYFRIRDLAAILKDTEAKFNVEFDLENHNVILEKVGDYEIIEGDLEDLPEGEQETIDSLHPVYLKGEEEPIEIKSYNINGNNYFRLRDLGKVLGFGVAYDYNTHTVLLSSTDLELEDIKVEEKEEVEEEVVEEELSEDEKVFYSTQFYRLSNLKPGPNTYYIDEPGEDENINYIEYDSDFKKMLYQYTFAISEYHDHIISIEEAEINEYGCIIVGDAFIEIDGVGYELPGFQYMFTNGEHDNNWFITAYYPVFSPEYKEAIGF